MPSWLATTMSVIAGGVLTMLAAWLADQRLNERERERRREERRERIVDRRNDFQRETMLALQVAAQQLLRNTGASLHQDSLAYRMTGKWQKQQLPDGLSQDHLRLNTEAMLLGSRVRDDEVRGLVDQLRSRVVGVSMSSSESEAERHMLAAGETQGALIQRIGQLVRGLDGTD